LDNTDDQQLNDANTVFDAATNTLTIELEDGGTATADFTALAGGSDDQNISGSGLNGTELTIGIEGGAGEVINLSSLANTDDQTIDEFTIVGGTLNISLEEDALAPSTVTLISTDANNDLEVGADGALFIEIPESAEETNTTLSFDDSTDELTYLNEDNDNDTVDLSSLNQNAAEVEYDPAASGLTATDTQAAIDEIVDNYKGEPKNIFFADDEGNPTDTQATPTLKDNGGFFWDGTKRFQTGAMYLGLKLNGNNDLSNGPLSTVGNHSKLILTERYDIPGNPNFVHSFPLQLHNEANFNGSGVGILFKVDYSGTNPGKGAILYDRQGTLGQGNFHFISSNTSAATRPTINETVLTIENDGDVILTGNIEDKTGTAPNVGDVLTNTASGTQWAAPAADGDADDTNELSDIALSGTTIQLTNGAAGATGVDLDATFATDADLLAATDDDISAVTFDGVDLTVEEGPTTSFSANLSALEESADIALVQADVDANEADADAAIANNSTAIAANSTAIANDGDTSDTNELSDVELVGTTIQLTNPVAGATGVNLDNTFATDDELAAATDDDITGVTFDGTNLAVAEGGTSFSADLSALEESTDITANTTAITTNATAIADHNTNDQDLSATNEIQTLSLAGNELTISGTGGNTITLPDSNLLSENLTMSANRTHDLDGNNLIFGGSGRIAIGSVNPDSKLDVDGQIQARQGFASTQGNAGNPAYGFYTNNDTDMGMYRIGVDRIGFSTNGILALEINQNQNVGIGNGITPLEKLHVDGNIRAEGNFISNNTAIQVPDYVFEKYFLGHSALNKNYTFSSLEEIESFLKKNHHLPGIKSAKEVEEDGLWNLSKSNLQNLEKIEELYLHTINQEKKIKQLESDKNVISKELEELKKEMEEIKALLKDK
jgi:hypothetical protein